MPAPRPATTMPMFSIELSASILFMSFSRLAYRMPTSAVTEPITKMTRPGKTVETGNKSPLTRMMP